MKKHITITGVIFLTVIFVLPMMAFGMRGRTGRHPGRMLAVMVQQKQVQTPILRAEQIIKIEMIQKELQEDNADTMKQLMTENQKEIMTKIQEEMSGLNTKWETS